MIRKNEVHEKKNNNCREKETCSRYTCLLYEKDVKKEKLSKWQRCYHSQDRTNCLKMKVIMISSQWMLMLFMFLQEKTIQFAQHLKNIIGKTNRS